MNVNYIVKVEDAKMADIQKALKDGGIKVRSIQEVYKEGAPAAEASEQKAG